MRIIDRPSPNFTARRGGLTPSLVVLHYTDMKTVAAALARLCDPETQVSAHYLIGETGVVYRLVAEEQRAWHAGVGSWRGQDDINSRSIGIELSNAGMRGGLPDFPAPQMTAAAKLLGDILARWAMPPRAVIAHSDMAPGRKIDPGPKFDWRWLAQKGLAVWSDVTDGTAPPDMASFVRLAEALGYGLPDGAGGQVLLDAYRLRFDPAATGALNSRDMARIADLTRHA